MKGKAKNKGKPLQRRFLKIIIIIIIVVVIVIVVIIVIMIMVMMMIIIMIINISGCGGDMGNNMSGMDGMGLYNDGSLT